MSATPELPDCLEFSAGRKESGAGEPTERWDSGQRWIVRWKRNPENEGEREIEGARGRRGRVWKLEMAPNASGGCGSTGCPRDLKWLLGTLSAFTFTFKENVCRRNVCKSIVASSLRPRIVGGENADIKQFPYQVQLRVRGDFFCGGCIISARHILTAAHCMTRTRHVFWPYLDVSIHSGTSSSRERGNVHRVGKVVIHPQWTDTQGTSLSNDIAVIKLEASIRFNAQQRKIDLPNSDILSGTKGIMTGWGQTAENSKLSVQLQKLKMVLLNSTDCQPYHSLAMLKEQMCAFHSDGRGSCNGDSGGPLNVENKVAGILSWITNGPCASGSAEVFTNVYAQKRFIESAMNTK